MQDVHVPGMAVAAHCFLSLCAFFSPQNTVLFHQRGLPIPPFFMIRDRRAVPPFGI
jgi:hypothetical protein